MHIHTQSNASMSTKVSIKVSRAFVFRFRARSLWSTARQTQNIHKHGSESASQDTSASSSGSNQNKQSPYLKQFVKAQEYRRLKQEWLSNVELGRSLIQGLGLFAKRDMDKVRKGQISRILGSCIGWVVNINVTRDQDFV